jgi:hypothetical protein
VHLSHDSKQRCLLAAASTSAANFLLPHPALLAGCCLKQHCWLAAASTSLSRLLVRSNTVRRTRRM